MKMIPLHTIFVSRSNGKDKDGKAVAEMISPPIGKPFDFTEAELADIVALNPDAVREPVNESPAEPAEAAKAAPKKAGSNVEL